MYDIIGNTSIYDVLLVAAVSLQSLCAAYLYRPEWKAVMLLLPIPFTIAALAVGKEIGISNLTGLVFLLLYAKGQWVFHQRFKVPIIAAIALSALGYCVSAVVLLPFLPQEPWAFWVGFVAVIVLACLILNRFTVSTKPGFRTTRPLWVKVPAIVLVVLLLVSIKRYL